MSHIPSAAMPHAGPTHHDEPAVEKRPAPPARNGATGNWPIAAIALGGVIALGAIAMAAPLLRTPKEPQRKRKAKGKKPQG
jgi:hypothetical protein